jgi:hypothetical protein
VAVYGDQLLYDNSTTDTGNTLSFVNGETIGNEINLAPGITSASVTSFSYEIYSPDVTFSGAVQMEAFLYENNGPGDVNGHPTPSHVYYDSGVFSLPTPLSFASGVVGTVNFDLSGSPVTVGNDLTLAVLVTGLANTDTLAMELFDPAGTGQNYADYWLNNGSWTLLSTPTKTDFGAQIIGVVPEPSTVSLCISGALLLGFIWLRSSRQETSSQK